MPFLSPNQQRQSTEGSASFQLPRDNCYGPGRLIDGVRGGGEMEALSANATAPLSTRYYTAVFHHKMVAKTE